MNFSKIFKKDPFTYWDNNKTSKLLDEYFQETGPAAMQMLWLNMIKSFLEKDRSVVSVPYKGMLLIISEAGEFLTSKFKETMKEALEFKEGKEKLVNFYIADLKANPALANKPGVISDELPNWLPLKLRNRYAFMIILNISKVSEYTKQILDKGKISYEPSLESFHKYGFRIISGHKKIIDIYDIIQKWILSGLTIEAFEGFIHFYIKCSEKQYYEKVNYKSEEISVEKRIKEFF